MNHLKLFDLIAPFYAWFYSYQVKHYRSVLEAVENSSLDRQLNVLDVGCGTGALTRLWSEHFKTVIGLDGSPRMIEHAQRLAQGKPIDYRCWDLREPWPFESQSFELVSASFVLHGLKPHERSFVLKEMKRVGRNVLVMDYLEKTNALISFVEWLEQGDYFNFRKTFKNEFKAHFKTIHIHSLNAYIGLYQAKA